MTQPVRFQTQKTSRSRRRGSAGFSLIEVLVALLILSVGLLGLAGLQTKSLKDTHQSYLRTQATLDAYQILDCIRANPTNVGNYAIALGATPGTTSIADQDLTAWKAALKDMPGPGDGSIVVSGDLVKVTVQWYEDTAKQSIQVQTEIL